MNKLIFATNNPHKLREIRQILKDKFEVDSLQDIGFQEEIAETSHTLEGNAILKARIIQQRYRRDCFADDTGLEIHALGGKPGVHSARYAGEDCIAENNIQKVLSELNGATDRKARFRAVIALILDGKEYLFEGIVNGTIIDTKRGKDGFGYDPIFVPDGKELTFAEMSPEEKNKIS
ncbi:MAG: RdgB/HAM1 family non-canonical purine NTP pyrophosphatase, partial [Bacteroidetes bacterium]|nr:RdgB/HAM1 family non-canonical purine NTP pyrophosphatase [Bacteroidota bacterium]